MFKGSIVALVTPMHADGSIDIESYEKLIAWHLEQGTDGLVIAGTTGESGCLEVEEKLTLVRKAIDLVKGKIPVIAGTGAVGTDATCRATQQAMEAGADGVLIMSPPYVKPPQRGLIQHYQAVAEAAPIPIILYNVPGRTASDLQPETVAELAKISNIVAIKEATGSLERLRELRAACGDAMTLLSGDDITACDFMLQGGDGVISVTANIVPKEMSALCHLCVNDKAEAAAKELDKKLSGLHQDLFLEANPIPTKWLLAKLGLISNHLRLPLVPLDEQLGEQLYSSYLKAK